MNGRGINWKKGLEESRDNGRPEKQETMETINNKKKQLIAMKSKDITLNSTGLHIIVVDKISEPCKFEELETMNPTREAKHILHSTTLSRDPG